ncbi:hypothetical protein IWW38_003082 [Coemansia aciculifera]|uniref:Uncharacterized protein n=1 Tax=Coemansia aciculifera TaxID=417176 RepID=A0ACC1M3F9_9FUNG|nr:hypothetical protein IWW38_003082 [Coemansia aciculifera]
MRYSESTLGGSLLGKLDHYRTRSRPPLTITRVDCHPWPYSSDDLPALDISEIIRRKDEPQTPLSASTPAPPQPPSSDTRSSITSDTTASVSIHTTVAITLPRPSTAGAIPHFSHRASLGSRPSTACESPSSNGQQQQQQRRRLRHDYFRVATMDGQSTIPASYKCPIATCETRFSYFEHLQGHWTEEHPWNRGGILTPVCDGGIRRLGWWEHKRRFFASLVHGKHRAEFPECPVADGTRLRRKSSSIEDVCRSDYGDITLRGSRTYHVSPRVVPMWQVARWEATRDSAAAKS